jgi:hypothetical protein
VFLDLMLPDTNGYDICRAIKAQRATCLVPVVVVTARLADENRTRCLQAGAQAFVPKPYTPDQIFNALAEAEAWRRDLENEGLAGQFPLDAVDDHQALGLTRLRCALVALGRLDEAVVTTLLRTLDAIAQGARSWGRRHGIQHVADLFYRVERDALVLTIRDRGNWFRQGDFTEAAAGYDPDLSRVFDRIERDDRGCEVVLVRRFPPVADDSTSH